MGLFGNDQTVMTTFKGKDSMSPVVRNVKRSMASFKRDAITGFGLGAGMNVFSLATKGIGMVTDYLGDSIKAAQEEEVSIAKLTTSLKANIAGWDGNTDAIEAVLAARMKLGFSDDEQRTSLTMLIAITHDATKALDIQRTAMDLARMRGMSLADATTLLGKVAGGNIGILSRYGIKIAKGASTTEALAAIQKLAAGQAVAYGKASAGASQRLNVALGELSETVGKLIAGPAADFTGWLADLISVSDRLTPKMQGIADKISGIHDAASEDGGAGNWFGTGTALDSVVDAWNAVNDAIAPVDVFADRMQVELVRAQKLAGYVNELMPLALSLGATGDELKVVARAAIDAGWTVGQLRDAFVEAGATIEDGGGTIEDLGETITGVIPPSVKEFKKAIGTLASITKNSMDNAIAEAKVGAAQFRWAMEHPLAGDKLANFYETQIRKAGRRARRAQKAHNEEAYAIELTALANWKGLLGEFKAARLVIRADWKTPGLGTGLGPPGAGGARASGGPVSAGGAYVVGERGPEILVMGNRGGNIVPNGGGAPIRNVIYLDGRVIYDNVNRRMGRDIALNGSV